MKNKDRDRTRKFESHAETLTLNGIDLWDLPKWGDPADRVRAQGRKPRNKNHRG